jgi:ribosome-binding protein aMBF1 (putative translation factor)
MATKFADFMRGVEQEAAAEGPEAVAELQALRDHFRLGRQVAQARLQQKLSQAQVAKRAHVDQADVSRIERGVANPTLGTLSAVADAVGLVLDLKRRRRTS